MKNFAYDHNPILLYFRLKDLVVVLTMDLYEHRSYIIFKCGSQLLKFFQHLKTHILKENNRTWFSETSIYNFPPPPLAISLKTN